MMLSRALPIIIGDRQTAKPRQYIRSKIQKGLLPVINLGDDQWIFSVGGIEHFCELRQLFTEGLKVHDLQHLIGAKERSVGYAAAAGLLETIFFDGRTRVTRQSFMDCLATILSDNVSPEEWLALRAASTRPLLSTKEAAKEIGVTRESFRKTTLRNSVIRHVTSLRSDHGTFYVLPESIDEYKALQKPLTANEKAKIFGVSRSQIEAWQESGALTCPLHTHGSPHTLYVWCMTALLSLGCGSGANVEAWVSHCLTVRSIKLVTEAAAMKLLGCGQEWLRQQKLDYITRPSGRRVYRASQILKLQ